MPPRALKNIPIWSHCNLGTNIAVENDLNIKKLNEAKIVFKTAAVKHENFS